MKNKASQKKKTNKKVSLSDFQKSQPAVREEENFDLDEIDIEQQRLLLEQIKEEASLQAIQSSVDDDTLEPTANSDQQQTTEGFISDEQLARLLQDEENGQVATVIGGAHSSTFLQPVYQDVDNDELMRAIMTCGGQEYDDDDNSEDDNDMTLDEEMAMDSEFDVQYISNANSSGLGGDHVDALMRADTKVYNGQMRDHSAQQFSSRRNKKETIQRIRTVDKQDQNTAEKVLDHRTMMILYKLLNSGTLITLNGCVSSGKESHIYHAIGNMNALIEDKEGTTPTEPGKEIDVCIKIFKTVGVSFRKREDYQNSEHRFKDKMRTNSQKNVKKYAEKEMRNLKKLQNAGIPCPIPYLLKDHVMVMSFIGKQGFPAPSLRDANFNSEEKLFTVYGQVVQNMRKMYKDAHLIHSDLSEYNILYYHGQVYFIDVSQSVESHHVNAKAFLRNDCHHVNDFFKKQGLISILTDRELFEYIINTDSGMNEEELLETAFACADGRNINSIDQRVDDSYFADVCLPQSTLNFEDDQADTNSLVHRMQVQTEE